MTPQRDKEDLKQGFVAGLMFIMIVIILSFFVVVISEFV